MRENNENPLKIYNASAGSGKTYHLVREYIALLIGEGSHPTLFSQIIAMTFTNKAALEMKERIIRALDEIGNTEFHQHKNQVLITDLSKLLSIKEDEVISRSRLALKLILHQYEDFHVMTIDKFNLRLIKSFGRDLDLPAEFEVVLDETELIEKIVDGLLNQLSDEENQTFSQLIFNYAKANIDDEKSWNFKRNLVDFAKILSSEQNNAIIDQLLEMEFSNETYGKLLNERKELDQKALNIAENIGRIMTSNAVSADQLPGKTNTYNAITKLVELNSFPVKEDILSKTLLKNYQIELKDGQIFPEELRSSIQDLIDLREKEVEHYATLDLFLSNFFNMALLQYMARELRKVKLEEQVIRISEFNTLISKLIQEENAPFIYERLGTRFKHFLLDEFQDTSRLQWLNLVPLIHNSIAENNDNLIVGDPKQSIYRFKNGVAEQFVALPGIYNPEGEPNVEKTSNYFKDRGQLIPLENNWRSGKSIIEFNNSFFAELKIKLPEISSDFYNSIHQNPQSKFDGYVNISSKPGKVKSEELVPDIIDYIEHCIKDGFDLGDICLLGDRKKDCNAWALGLNEAGYKVVSADSLLINSSLEVQLTIAYLKRRLKPSGESEMKRFAELYFRIHSLDFSEYQSYIEERISEKGKKFRVFNDELFLTDHFGGSDSFFFNFESIYDLIQSFYRIIKYDELSNPYLHHLADIAFEFGSKKGPDLKGFIEDYERQKGQIAVQIPESKEAIKIMTIHKSKGLEFPVVILPSMDFQLDVKSNFLIEEDDYILYKKPTKSEVITTLKELHATEESQVFTDRVNLCYVAMTRPVERLYVINNFENTRFGAVFHDTLSTLPKVKQSEDEITLELGTASAPNAKKSSSAGELFEPKNITDLLWFPDISLRDREELTDEEYLSESRQFGLQFHELVSKINHVSEIDTEIVKAFDQGLISAENIDGLKSKLNDLLFRPDYQSLFEGAVNTLSEQSIITENGKILRPDKFILKPNQTIIIDYKTGLPKDKDNKQIKEYCDLLSQMGYPEVQGYLFYTSTDSLRLVS